MYFVINNKYVSFIWWYINICGLFYYYIKKPNWSCGIKVFSRYIIQFYRIDSWSRKKSFRKCPVDVKRRLIVYNKKVFNNKSHSCGSSNNSNSNSMAAASFFSNNNKTHIALLSAFFCMCCSQEKPSKHKQNFKFLRRSLEKLTQVLG